MCNYPACLSNKGGALLHDNAQHSVSSLPLKLIEDNDLLIRGAAVWLIRASLTHDNALAGDPSSSSEGPCVCRGCPRRTTPPNIRSHDLFHDSHPRQSDRLFQQSGFSTAQTHTFPNRYQIVSRSKKAFKCRIPNLFISHWQEFF